jgi:hypothetical protein
MLLRATSQGQLLVECEAGEIVWTISEQACGPPADPLSWSVSRLRAACAEIYKRTMLTGRRLLGHFALLASLLMLSPRLLLAQQSSTPNNIEARTPAFVPATRARRGPVPRTLPDAPRSQTESPVKPLTFRIRYHYTLINTQAAVNLQQFTETTGKAEYFSESSQWLTSAYIKTDDPMIKPTDHLQHWGRYIPWSSSILPRVSEQTKTHPHVTSVLKIFRPQF